MIFVCRKVAKVVFLRTGLSLSNFPIKNTHKHNTRPTLEALALHLFCHTTSLNQKMTDLHNIEVKFFYECQLRLPQFFFFFFFLKQNSSGPPRKRLLISTRVRCEGREGWGTCVGAPGPALPVPPGLVQTLTVPTRPPPRCSLLAAPRRWPHMLGGGEGSPCALAREIR